MKASKKTTLELMISVGVIVSLVLVGISGYEAHRDLASASSAAHERSTSQEEQISNQLQDSSLGILEEYTASLSPEEKAELFREGAIMLGALMVR